MIVFHRVAHLLELIALVGGRQRGNEPSLDYDRHVPNKTGSHPLSYQLVGYRAKKVNLCWFDLLMLPDGWVVRDQLRGIEVGSYLLEFT